MKTTIKSVSAAVLVTVLGSLAQANPKAQATYTQTAREIRVIHRSIGLGQIVSSINSNLSESFKEVVVGRHGQAGSNETAYSASAEVSRERSKYNGWRRSGKTRSSSALADVSGSYSWAYNNEWDTTAFLLQNPQEVAGFDSKLQANWMQLRARLLSFLDRNESKIVRLKELGVLNLAAAYELGKTGKPVQSETLLETLALLSDISFLGTHEITRCMTVETTDRFSSYDSAYSNDTSAALSAGYSQEEWRRRKERSRAGFIGLSASSSSVGERSSYWEQIGSTETSCTSSTDSAQVSAKQAVYRVSLTELDQLLQKWVDALEVQKLARPSEIKFETWNSPYYR